MSASGHSSFDPPSEADPIFQTGTLRHREVRALAGAMQGFVHSLCSGGWKHKGISKILGQCKRGPGADDKPAHSGEKQGLGEPGAGKGFSEGVNQKAAGEIPKAPTAHIKALRQEHRGHRG